MAWPHDIRTPTNPFQPRPIGYCDRCYRRWYLDDLDWQFDIRGQSLVDIGIMVCPECYDEPAEVLRPPLIIGPEGVIKDPRPPNYAANFRGGVPAPHPVSRIITPRPNDIPDDTYTADHPALASGYGPDGEVSAGTSNTDTSLDNVLGIGGPSPFQDGRYP